MLVDDVAVDFPELRIILAHPSFPWQDEALAVATHKPYVYIDLSGWSPKYFPPQLVQYANTLLKDKVLFGSDYPGDHPGPLARRLRQARHQARGPPEDPQGQRRAPARPRRLTTQASTQGDLMTTTVHGLDGVQALAGQDLGASYWLEITQERVNTFADATGDHQWIHVDPERAKDRPVRRTIAHGYLTLSLIIPLFVELLDIQGVGMSVNYGLDKVRFPAPSRSAADPAAG